MTFKLFTAVGLAAVLLTAGCGTSEQEPESGLRGWAVGGTPACGPDAGYTSTDPVTTLTDPVTIMEVCAPGFGMPETEPFSTLLTSEDGYAFNALSAALALPSEPSADTACPAVAEEPLYVYATTGRGTTYYLQIPTDACGLYLERVRKEVTAIRDAQDPGLAPEPVPTGIAQPALRGVLLPDEDPGCPVPGEETFSVEGVAAQTITGDVTGLTVCPTADPTGTPLNLAPDDTAYDALLMVLALPSQPVNPTAECPQMFEVRPIIYAYTPTGTYQVWIPDDECGFIYPEVQNVLSELSTN